MEELSKGLELYPEGHQVPSVDLKQGNVMIRCAILQK